jgi:hypothetical protein
VGFEPGSSVAEADAMSTAPGRHFKNSCSNALVFKRNERVIFEALRTFKSMGKKNIGPF